MLETEEFTDLEIILKKLEKIDNIECKPVLIGSHALKHYYPTYILDKKYIEYDIICNKDFIINLLNNDIFEKLFFKINTNKDFPEFKEYKIYLITKNNIHYDIDIIYNNKMSNYLISKYNNNINTCVIQPMINIYIASLEVLEGITYSHIYHNINFLKHIKKLHILRKLININSNFLNNYNLIDFLENDKTVISMKERSDEVINIIKLRRDECNIKFGVPAAHINLNMSNDDFLEKEGNLTVKKYIKHDLIHDLVKINDKPMYLYLKEDDKLDKAYCNKKLWNKLPFKKKLDCVKEDAMVLTIERRLLHDNSLNYKIEFIEALCKICTFITKGWFREFAIDNFNLLTDCPYNLTEFATKIKKDYYNNLIKTINNPTVLDNNQIKDISNLIFIKQFNIDLNLDLSKIHDWNDYKTIVSNNIINKVDEYTKDRLLHFIENNTNRLFYIKKNTFGNAKDIYVSINISNTEGNNFFIKHTNNIINYSKNNNSGDCCYYNTYYANNYEDYNLFDDKIYVNKNFIDFNYNNFYNNIEINEKEDHYINFTEKYENFLNYYESEIYKDDIIKILFKYNFTIYETDKEFNEINFSYDNKYLLSNNMNKLMDFSFINTYLSYNFQNDYDSDYSSDYNSNKTSNLSIMKLILNYSNLSNNNLELNDFNKKMYYNIFHKISSLLKINPSEYDDFYYKFKSNVNYYNIFDAILIDFDSSLFNNNNLFSNLFDKMYYEYLDSNDKNNFIEGFLKNY